MKSAKKRRTKVHTMYTTVAKNSQKKRKEKTINYSGPQTKPKQSMKSKKDIEFLPINSLVQDNKLHINRIFNLWTKSSSFRKDFLFLSFYIVQKRHNGVTLQNSFRFLSTKKSCQPNKVSYRGINLQRVMST